MFHDLNQWDPRFQICHHFTGICYNREEKAEFKFHVKLYIERFVSHVEVTLQTAFHKMSRRILMLSGCRHAGSIVSFRDHIAVPNHK